VGHCLRPLLLAGVLLAGCKQKPLPKVDRDLSVSEVARFIRSDVKDKRGWAADARLALSSARQPVNPHSVCQVLAIVEQESGYEADPAVPGLGKVVKGELDAMFDKLGPAAGPVRSALLGHVGPGATQTFEARLGRVRTEQDADQLYREIVDFHRAAHPGMARAMDILAPDLVERFNPITTSGSMQVSVAWAIEAGDRDELSPTQVRDLLYTRVGGLKYGTARLFAHDAPYDSPKYRFADYNAGLYASRNAALQEQLSGLTGRKLALDGDFMLYDSDGDFRRKTSNTLAALLVFRSTYAPELSERQVRRDARLEKTADFDDTATVRALRAAVSDRSDKAATYARLPDVALESPKMKSGRSTRWFADNVQRRYDQCRARSKR